MALRLKAFSFFGGLFSQPLYCYSVTIQLTHDFSVILRSEATKNPVNFARNLTGFFASLRMTSPSRGKTILL